MLTKIANCVFASMAGTILTFSVYRNNIAEPAFTFRSIRGRISPYPSPPLPSLATSISIERKFRGGASCDSLDNELSCNKTQDGRGNECHWCTDPLSNSVCVAHISYGFEFAPCNKWVCHSKEMPEKSDITACERVMV